jgi:hypothetical protein
MYLRARHSQQSPSVATVRQAEPTPPHIISMFGRRKLRQYISSWYHDTVQYRVSCMKTDQCKILKTHATSPVRLSPSSRPIAHRPHRFEGGANSGNSCISAAMCGCAYAVPGGICIVPTPGGGAPSYPAYISTGLPACP